MPSDTPDLSRAALEAHARYYEDWARDIRRHGGRSVDAHYADAIAATLRALAARVVELEAALGRYYEALRAIEVMPEQGGCDDGVDAVEMWTMMRKVARAALETPNAK